MLALANHQIILTVHIVLIQHVASVIKSLQYPRQTVDLVELVKNKELGDVHQHRIFLLLFDGLLKRYKIILFLSSVGNLLRFFLNLAEQVQNILFQEIRNNAEFAYELMQIACKELGESNRYIKDIAQKSVKERLAEILLLIAHDFGIEPDGTLKLAISREDLSNFVGTATETLIRLLSEYKTEGLVEAKGRKIKLLNPEKLKCLAGD